MVMLWCVPHQDEPDKVEVCASVKNGLIPMQFLLIKSNT